MSRSIRICSYLLLPLIYLLVNVKIAQLGGKLSHYHRHFFTAVAAVICGAHQRKKIDDRLRHRRGLTAFNFLFGQSLNAGKYVTSTMLFCLYCGHYWDGLEYPLQNHFRA
ncbi:putative colanic acid polymerase [Salmonella enterica subsp. houtenae]|nr:putative colanic acid polymerase [Salmonella enterica subsp. houtenae]